MKNKLADTLAITTELLKQRGVKAYEIILSNTNGISGSVRLGDTENIKNYLDNFIGITIYDGKKSGNTSSNDTSIFSIKEMIRHAKTIAKYTEDDIYSGLAPKEIMAWSVPNLGLYNKEIIPLKRIIEQALICENEALGIKNITNSEGVEVVSLHSNSYYANSHGLIANKKLSKHSLSCSVIAKNKQDMQSSYDYKLGINFSDLGDVREIGREAAKKAVDKLNPKKLKSQVTPIIFTAKISAGIISNIITALNGSSQYKKNSFLLNKINKKIAPEWFSIIEKPLEKSLLTSQAFDGDGVLKSKQYFVKDGVVKSYIMGQYSANQLGLRTTANAGGVSNCFVAGNKITFDELVEKMHTGLLVTDIMGQGVNITTGDYSRGASGFWVEKGVIQYPVSGITIAGNLSNMLEKIIAISNDIDNRLLIKIGSMLIADMTISGL